MLRCGNETERKEETTLSNMAETAQPGTLGGQPAATGEPTQSRANDLPRWASTCPGKSTEWKAATQACSLLTFDTLSRKFLIF